MAEQIIVLMADWDDETQKALGAIYEDLRKDVPAPSFPTEKLQQNTTPRDNCYVVPKMME